MASARYGGAGGRGLRVRVALNLLYLIPGVVGGTETYARSLIHSIAALDDENEYVVFVNKLAADLDITPGPNFRRVICPFLPLRRVVRYGWEQGILPFQLGSEKIDIVHSLGFVVPLAARSRQIVTVHDLNFLSHLGWHTTQGRRILRFFVERSVSRADHVITISEFSRAGLISKLGVPPQKVTVIHSAAARHLENQHPAARTDYDPAGGMPYIVALSGLPMHKNIARLVSAFEQIQDVVPHSLVVVGHLPDNPEYRRSLEAKAGRRIHFTGYLSDAEIAAALKGASLLAFPSLYEGFGLPVIEAQQAGIPVTCSSVAALPEVAGAGAHYFDPLSVDSIAAALRTCILDADLRKTLVREGCENARRFSWEKAARETLAIYHATVHAKRRRQRDQRSRDGTTDGC
jgi:glycosyltransferase involved in cell wall biosynthesis